MKQLLFWNNFMLKMKASCLLISYKIKHLEEAMSQIAINKICLLEFVEQIIYSMINQLEVMTCLLPDIIDHECSLPLLQSLQGLLSIMMWQMSSISMKSSMPITSRLLQGMNHYKIMLTIMLLLWTMIKLRQPRLLKNLYAVPNTRHQPTIMKRLSQLVFQK